MKNREIFHQTLAMMTIWLNELVVAIDDGGLIPSLTSLATYWWFFFLDGYIVKIIGAVIAAILLDKVGRKSLLSICATTFCLSWLLMLLTNSLWIFYLARLALGIAGGINDVTNAAYLGEISSPSVRSTFGAIVKFMYSLGLLIGFITATILSYKTTALINFFITLLSLTSIFWMVEPVQYLLMKGKYDQAEKNFIWLKGVTNLDQVADEFEKIKQNVNAEVSKKSSITKIFTYPANYKSLLIILTFSSLVGFINYDLLAYIELLFASSDFNPAWNEIVFLVAVTQFLVIASVSFIIRRFNRRPMMMVSFSLLSVTLFLLSVSINTGVSNAWHKKFVVICFLLFNSVYVVAFTYTFLLRSELFPLSMKAIGGSMSIIGYTLGGFLMTKILSPLIRHEYLFSILPLSVLVVLILFLIYIKWPETENKSLTEIQEKLESENDLISCEL